MPKTARKGKKKKTVRKGKGGGGGGGGAGNSRCRVDPQMVLEQLPFIQLAARVRGSDAVKRSLLRAGGPRLSAAIFSICKNLEAKNIKPRRRLNSKQSLLVQQLARGGRGAQKRLSQKGGLAIVPLIAALAPAIVSVARSVVGAIRGRGRADS